MRTISKLWIASAVVAGAGIAFEAARQFSPEFNAVVTPIMDEVKNSTAMIIVERGIHVANKVSGFLSLGTSSLAALYAWRAANKKKEDIESGKFPDNLRMTLTWLNSDGTMAIKDLGDVNVSTMIEWEDALGAYRKAYASIDGAQRVIPVWEYTRDLRRKYYVTIADSLSSISDRMRDSGLYGIDMQEDVRFVGMEVREPQFETIEENGEFKGFKIIKWTNKKGDKTTIEQGRTMVVPEGYIYEFVQALDAMTIKNGRTPKENLEIISSDIEGQSQELRDFVVLFTRSNTLDEAKTKMFRGDAKHIMRIVTHAQLVSKLAVFNADGSINTTSLEQNITAAVVNVDSAVR